MTEPAAPEQPVAESVLGPGAYGDPANPGLTRQQYEAQESPEQGPANPSSDPTPITGAGGATPDANPVLPAADGNQAQAPATEPTAVPAPVATAQPTP